MVKRAVALLLAAVCVGQARADVTQSISAGYGNTPASPGGAIFNGYTGLDPLLGVLFDVQITFGAYAAAPTGSHSYTASGSAGIESGNVVANQPFTPVSGSCVVATAADLCGTTLTTHLTYAVPLAQIGSFVGPASHGLGPQGSFTLNIDGVSRPPAISTSRVVGSVTYVTTAVPEPSTWLLMAAGFVGIGAALRRRERTGARVMAF